MSRVLMVVLGILGLGVFVAVIAVASGIGIFNGALSHEAGIKAQYTQNQNNYDNMFKKIREVAQVPDMYTADLQKVFSQVVQGRKGSDQELVRVIKEANPSFDAGLYRQLQQVIEESRNSFEADQKMLIDKVRAYEVARVTFPNNIVMGAFGFPRIDLAKYTIVTSDETATAFETKKSAPFQLREKPAAAAAH